MTSKKIAALILSATLIASGGALKPVKAEMTSLDSIYANAYKTTMTALESKTQKSINTAREAIKVLPKNLNWAIGEFSKQVDTVQQPIFEKAYNTITIAQKTINQANINEAKAAIDPDMPEYYRNSYSSAVDAIQQQYMKKAVDAFNKAVQSKLQIDVDDANAIFEDIKTSTNPSIVEWVDLVQGMGDLKDLSDGGTHISNYVISSDNGTFGPADSAKSTTIKGNILISDTNGKSVTLQNMNIEGILSVNFGAGNVVLNNVKVNGVTITNVGSQSLHIAGNSTIINLNVQDNNNDAHIVIEGNASITSANVFSGANLEVSSTATKANPFGNVIITPILAPSPSNAVSLNGAFESVNVTKPSNVKVATGSVLNNIIANSDLTLSGTGKINNVAVGSAGARLDLQAPSIGSVAISKNAAGAIVNISNNTTVSTLNVNAPIAVTGAGTITNANIGVSGTTMETKPTNLSVVAGVTATVGGQVKNDSNSTIITSVPTDNTPPVVVNPPSSGGGTYIPPVDTQAITINISSISGVTLPVTGEIPVKTLTATNEYTATIAWSGDPTTFAASTVYTATITITPKSGYTLTGVPANFFTVVGSTTTNSTGSGIIRAVFPATAAATSANVANLTELKTALADTNIKIINITANILDLDAALLVNREVTINGGGQTLAFTAALNNLENGLRQGILVEANKVTINNLKVQMAGTAGWQGVYGIQVYNSTGVTLNDVTASGADGAILINASKVELTGTTTVTGNEFGGIEVSKGTADELKSSELTLSGTLVNGSEAYGQPTIWVVNCEGLVSGSNVPTTTNTTIKADQTQYYLNPAAAVASANVANLTELKAALADTNIKIINITANISNLDAALLVNREVTINGGGQTLAFTAALNTLENGFRQGILVEADKVTINNLKVQMAGTAGWQGVYGIQVYNSTGVVLNDVTASGADGAILINASKVELTGTTTVTGNEFGGIEVSKGTAAELNDSELTLNGTLVNSSEAYGQPTIWVVNGEGLVSGSNVPTTTNTTIKADQTQYYLNPAAATSANVANLTELKIALANTNIKIINITADISNLDAALLVNREVTINGEGQTLAFTAALNNLENGFRQGILVEADKVTINNLKVQMAGTAGWQGVYGIQVYNSTGVVLNDVTASGADGAILINASKVELTGTTTVTGNEFGGIEVSKGTADGLKSSELTLSGTLVNDSEAYGQPTIWVVNGEGLVSGSNVPTTTNTTIKADQTQYYLISCNGAAPTETSEIDFLPNYTAGFTENTNELVFEVGGVLNGPIDVNKIRYTTSESGEYGYSLAGTYKKVDFTIDPQPGEYYYLMGSSETIIYIVLAENDADEIKKLIGYGNDSFYINANYDRITAESNWYSNANGGMKYVSIHNNISITNNSINKTINGIYLFDKNNKEIGSVGSDIKANGIDSILVDSQTTKIVFYEGDYVPNVKPTSGKMKIVEFTPDMIGNGITADDTNWIDVNETNFGIVNPATIAVTNVPTENVVTEEKIAEGTAGNITGFSPVSRTPILVSLTKGAIDYTKVRVIVEGLNNGIQLIAQDSAGNWYNIVKTGWGPVEGFALQNATTKVYLVANTPGNYTATIKLVDISDSSKVIATATASINAIAAD